MGDSSSLIMSSIYVPDANRKFYWEGRDPKSFEQLWGDKIVCCSRIYKDFSFGCCVCRLNEY